MKKIVLLIFSFISFFVSAVIFSFPSLHHDLEKLRLIFKRNGPQENQINLLFIQQAKSIQFMTNKNKNHCYRLILDRPDPKILYFSNEPKRMMGYLRSLDFVQMLRNNQKHYQIIPNVALMGYVQKNNRTIREINEVVTISNPHFYKPSHKIRYTACLLKKGHIAANLKLYNASLFFDHIHPWPP